MHVLDQRSPLHGFDVAQATAAQAQLFVTIEARNTTLATVVHGIRKHAAGGRIAVRAFRDDSTLRLEVRDSGPGCAPGEPFSRGSIGVPATRARLDYLYRDPEALSFRRDGDEFVAGVRIPLRLA